MSERKLIGQAPLARKRYGKHPRTVTRWVEGGIFPPADVILNGKNYWYEDTVEAHERSTVASRKQAVA